MKITPEMMRKFGICMSAEEIMDLAKKNNFVLTKEQAQKLFDLLQSENISEKEMEEICAGMVVSTLGVPLSIKQRK